VTARRAALVLVALAACSKHEAPSAPLDAAAGSSASPSSSDSPAPTASAAPQGPSTWSGTYKSVVGSIYVPDGGEWANTKWRGDPGEDGVGAGTLTLTATPAGDVTGTLDGVLGPATVAGKLVGDELTASISGQTFTGTLDAKRGTTGTLEGTARAASTFNAHFLREASFSLAKKP
jgi:hypothetical protein